jgi:hypothetical protein
LHILSKPHLPRRAGEWTANKAVTFIVTLAATSSVTLAASQAGMSRKSAYALKSRDPAFAAAWALAMKALAIRPRQGNKVEEVHGLPVSPGQGDTRAAVPGARRACVTSPSRRDRERDFAGVHLGLQGAACALSKRSLSDCAR